MNIYKFKFIFLEPCRSYFLKGRNMGGFLQKELYFELVLFWGKGKLFPNQETYFKFAPEIEWSNVSIFFFILLLTFKLYIRAVAGNWKENFQ